MQTTEQEHLKDHLDSVYQKINAAAKKVGRNPAEIDLVVVTKGKSALLIRSLYELGITKIGESYLKEALFKQELLRDQEIDWHMIGNIQKNKAKHVAHHFNSIHSVSGLALAKALNLEAQKIDQVLSVYLELNLSQEENKGGWFIRSEIEQSDFWNDFKRVGTLSALRINGLMTMAPFAADPEKSRVYFRQLREIRDRLMIEHPDLGSLGLSMGMSSDYEIAVEEGSTILRIGSAIVGER
jgi:pyridoxal phosphate enzyme (YggS family)